MGMQKLAVITGPTACGKTALSIAVAQKTNAEIISADSVQIYRYLNIGSAKPTEEEKQGVVHHLLDCVELDCPFSVADFQVHAKGAIEDIAARGKLPLVVGGTGLYINALTTALDFTEASVDEQFRREWNDRESASPGSAHAALAQIDPITANRLHPNDKKRVIRALEVHHLTGKPLSTQTAQFRRESAPYDLRMIGISWPREVLYARINQRVDIMIQDGLIEEVDRILKMGYDRSLPSLQGLGYKEIAAYLFGECTLSDAIDKIKQGSRRFAKRQMTWFRRDERIHWLDASKMDFDDMTAAALELFA